MVSYHPAKVGGHSHCSSGDMMFLVVEGQDYTCPLFIPHISVLVCHGYTQ